MRTLHKSAVNKASLIINWFEAFCTDAEKAVLKDHRGASDEDVAGKKKFIVVRLEQLCKARLKDFHLSITGKIPQMFQPGSKAVFLVNTLATAFLALKKANAKLPAERGGGMGGGSVEAPTRYRVDMNLKHFKEWLELLGEETLQNSEYNVPNCNEDSQGDLSATSLPSEISAMPETLLTRSPHDSAGSRHCQSPERGGQPSQGEGLLATSPPSGTTPMEQPSTPPRSIAKMECDDSDCVTPLLVGLRTPNMECAQQSSSPAFSILRPLSNIPSKRVFLVRHGESEYNFALANNKAWEDPQVFDAPLTAKGEKQAKSLRGLLSNIPNIENALWVCSPLSRAVETMLHGCPVDVDDLVASGRLVIRAEVSEFLQTTSDIGLPASMLRQKFPKLTGAMEDLSEKWWFGDPKNNDLLTKRCEEFETKESERDRINTFRQFLEGRPESVVVCFGHSLFWKHFSGSKDVLDHCAMMRMRL
ncbi:hypothetical protein CYMTET_50245 [Cymbomonas tetramitiformis]|uniref:Uncharacterized protein n=1 Tax=Cymbomonas tetramitiformis TaxID=36881 RepID=A0AAE0BPQ7_9CHLO|nr:hypothetical protein CYMTET_50245 [Cymbomonas tetramitiformis]